MNNELEGCGSFQGLMEGSVLESAWRGWGKLRKPRSM